MTLEHGRRKALSPIEARRLRELRRVGRGFSRSCGNTRSAEGRRKAHELIASNFRGRMKHAFHLCLLPGVQVRLRAWSARRS